ncbi:O-methyltransferase [Devosia nitrariae]|uniref:O-methyltransferase n=1 Tax=Devosia nitrariae TaxID=2071872 RepID=A0ABQ5WCJ4_9HYPH|nr:O-methyltransferase [Devosia nitrariae]GLQ57428.1 O-methyltransferase [Devosia nitrariae]
MTGERWRAVDDYVAERLLGRDEALAAALEANAAAGLPAIDVSPLQGKFLELLVRIAQARRLLEIGTLGGYSTISMARALPADGQLVTLEYEPHHAEVAAANIARAGVADKVRIVVGPAAASLPKLAAEEGEPFDLIFIDADKPNNRTYLDWAVKLSRPGTLIILDNVVRGGEVIEPDSADASIIGTRAAFDFIADHPRLSATALQTVGAKGWDGFAMMVVS